MHTTDQLNTSLAGRYTIERLIGEGGMATVYLARDLRHNRRVALKVLKPDLGAVVGVERFLSEIQVTANLQHPNLLPLFDSGAADNLLFYVMPYVEGESLRARLQREKQLPIDEVVRMASAVASALDYAHRHGVIHRDLKPENILLHEGQPLVADFGIALAVRNAGGNRITQTGLSLGTPQYMSPEQATGDRAIDGRTDIYSLGAVIYEMLTGDPPHVGSTSQAVIARVLTDTPRRIRLSRPSVPEQIEIAVEKALEKLPADRWATGRELSEALSGARVVTRSTALEDASVLRLGRRRIPVREAAAWTLAGVAVAMAAALLFMPRGAPQGAGAPMDFELQFDDSVGATAVGAAAALAISRDGSTIVFQARRPGSGTPSLYVRRLDDLEAREIRGTEDARAPVFSADGSEILFSRATSSNDLALRRLPLQGGTPRVFIDSAAVNGQTSWREGGPVVYSTGRIPFVLYAMSPETRERTVLLKVDSARGIVRFGYPDVLPGGKAALITLWTNDLALDQATIGVVSIPDGKLTDLGIRGFSARYTTAGGGHLVYATSEAWIYALPFSARTGKARGAPFPVVDGVRVSAGGAAAFAVADNGTLVYMPGNVTRPRREVLTVDRAGTEQPVGVPPGIYVHPRISPDGRQFIMEVWREAAGLFPNPDIWRFDFASKVLTRMTTDSNSANPTWIDRGSRVAFGRLRLAADTGILARGLFAGATTELLVPGRGFRKASGSRNGRYLALRRGLQALDIWVVHEDSLSSPRPLLAEAYQELAPAVSPDGRHIAYVTNRTGRSEVYVRPIVGTGAELQLSADGGIEPVWSPDGRELFYRAPNQMMSVRLTPGPVLAIEGAKALFPDLYVRATNSANYDVFPDGRGFLMLRDRTVSEAGTPIVVKLNWLARAPSSRRP